MAIELLDTRYNPTNGECLPGDDAPHTCQWYSLSIKGSSISYIPLFSTLVETCGTCPTIPELDSYFSQNPSHKLEQALSNANINSVLKNLIENNGGTFSVSLNNNNIYDKHVVFDGRFFEISVMMSRPSEILNNYEDLFQSTMVFSSLDSLYTSGPKELFLSKIINWYESNKYFISENDSIKNGYLAFINVVQQNSLSSNYPYIAYGSDFLTFTNVYNFNVNTANDTLDSRLVKITNDETIPFIILKPIDIFTKNLLITYDTDTCNFVEQIVSSNPYEANIVSPSVLFVKYITNKGTFLSLSDPEEFNNIKSEFEMNSVGDICKGACCFTALDNKNLNSYNCLNIKESQCTINYLTQSLITNNPIVDNNFVKITSVSWAGKDTLCENTNCEYRLPTDSIVGTCCAPGYGSNGDLGCIIKTEEQCRELNGFWNPPMPDGLGGYNPPGCSEQGTVVNVIDDSTKIVSLSGPVDCSLYDNNLSKNLDNPPKGSCCFFLPTNQINFLQNYKESLVSSKEVQIQWSYRNGKIINFPASFNLSVLNDGSVIKLCADSSDLEDIYDFSNENFISKIESSFNITNNGEPSEWKVKFLKLEDGGPYRGICIVLSVIK
jgi:hypothetical protein